MTVDKLKQIIKECIYEIKDEYKESILDLSFKSPEEFSKWMKSNIKYSNFTKLMSPEEVFEKRKGSCHDQVMFERYFFNKLALSHSIYFMIEYNDNEEQGGRTHSFLYYIKDNKFYWFENAWGGQEGIHEYNSLKKLKDDIKSKMLSESKYNKVLMKRLPNNIKYGMSLSEFVSKCVE